MFGMTKKPEQVAAPAAVADKVATPATGPKRVLFVNEELVNSKSILRKDTILQGGSYIAAQGLVVLGVVEQNQLLTTADESLIFIGATGRVDGGHIEAKDILVEGTINNVTITAWGRIEMGPSAVVCGNLIKGPNAEVYISPAANVDQMVMQVRESSGAERAGADGQPMPAAMLTSHGGAVLQNLDLSLSAVKTGTD